MQKVNRFPLEKLPPLYRGLRQYNLSESTTQDLRLGELIDLIGLETIRELPLAYAESGQGGSQPMRSLSILGLTQNVG